MLTNLDPVYMEWGTPVQWGKFLLFCAPQSVKIKETYPTRPGCPTPCKQGLRNGTDKNDSNNGNEHVGMLKGADFSIVCTYF